MNKTFALLAALAIAVAIAVGPASAITDGVPDGNGHPYVGLMVAQDSHGNPLWRCSGTLLSPTVYLTAGHCTEAPAAHAEIFFAAHIDTDTHYVSKAAGGTGCDNAAVTGYPCHGDVGGTTYPHPDYDPNRFFVRDLGVVALSSSHPSSNGVYGLLPEENQLDALQRQRGQQDVTFTAVGYGLQASFPDAASWKDQADKTRMVAHPYLLQINSPGFTGDFSLLLSNNHASGGTCFGDSGGPNFIGNSNVIAGVTSYGLNGNCAGTGGVYRLDRSWNLDWLSDTFGIN
jgi:Trypsin